ncbi:hypothetical protein LSAT2_022307 [Lamellibrachia satsuma]|nr:hypothetical protein LSAT2_022307 [Lamellibrachia satsuma]
MPFRTAAGLPTGHLVVLGGRPRRLSDRRDTANTVIISLLSRSIKSTQIKTHIKSWRDKIKGSQTTQHWWLIVGVVCVLKATGTTSCGGDEDNVKQDEKPRLPALCKLPAEPGLCLAYIPRWFFNSETGKCERFVYGGCGGNKNNFSTKEECDKMCWCPPPCKCYCEFGFQIDEYGCKICKCIDPCKGVFCPAGQICEAKKIECIKEPCPPVTQCIVPDPTCCEGRPYDHVKQVCCQRRLYVREDDVDCCAVDSIYRVNPPYNVIKEICCQGVVQERPCNAECCGRKAYNQLEMTCCDGELQKRPPNPKCCGKNAYDSRKFVCCGGRVQERPNNAFG